MIQTFDLLPALASDDDNAIAEALRSGLAWQLEVCRQTASADGRTESRRRHLWHADAMQAAYDVIPRLRRLVRQRGGGARTAAATNTVPATGPSMNMLVDIGWLAWDHRLESEAMRILGGIGGLVDGHMGRAMLQASALMKGQRSREATEILHDAVHRHGDPNGEASATLSLLWRALHNPAWEALARDVARRGTSETARAACLNALKSAEQSSMDQSAGQRGEQRQTH